MIRSCLRSLLCLTSLMVLQPAVAEEIRDYYSEPGINPFKETVNDGFNEEIDPFSGTLQLKYTDVHVPGNGGMDLKITRTYTSLPTDSFPRLGRTGLGWTMHFGRIVISESHRLKLCNQAAFPLTTIENPSLELPDGGREILVLNNIQNDGTLISRSNWKAQCHAGAGMLVTSPDGTRYTMDRFDYFDAEPSWHTTRIDDVHGNWMAIDWAVNAVGVNYITAIRRSEGGTIATFQYEDIDGPGIVVSSIQAGGQTWYYHYEVIPGFMFPNYKQLKSVTRPDGETWYFDYNPDMPDPNPNDGVPEKGIASYSLIRVTYPHGAVANYTYQLVQFDPGVPTEKTTSIHTKHLSGTRVADGTWTYTFAPFSGLLDAGPLRYDVTTVHAPEAIHRYYHVGKDYFSGELGNFQFFRPSFVGLLVRKETLSREANPRLIERRVNSWGARKISNEDFWHGAGWRSWWRDDGTYVPVLNGEYVNRDSRADNSTFGHAREYFDYDVYGNPGRIVDHSNLSSQPKRQVIYEYRNDTVKWILGLPERETHQSVEGSSETTLGHVEREYDANGLLLEVEDFGEVTTYTYHSEGDMETMRDARGNLTRYSNYKRGIARTERRPDNVFIYRTVNDDGTLESETNGRGHTTSYQYDDMHRLTFINYPVKADVNIRYENGFGVYRRVLTRGTYRQTETFNDFGSLLRVFREDTATGQTLARDMEYDAQHRQLYESYPNASIGTRTTYDALDRVLRIQHPDNTFVAYSYDDADTTVRNERDFPTRYRYMSYGPAYSDDPASIVEPENVTTIISRDVWGNVVEVFQGEQLTNGAVRGYGKTYRYDERRLLVESVEREVGTTVFDHDEVGNVISERVNNLPAVTFVYDALNRRTRVDFADATPDVITEYDADGNPKSVTKGTTRWDYVYDANDNLESETLTLTHSLLGQRVYGLAHQYSDLDVLAQTTYPSGLVIAYEPDAFGRATRAGSFASNVTYHPSGPVASYQLANGVTTTVALNQRLLTQSISAGGAVNLSYGYDSTGNVLQILDGHDPSKNVQMNTSSYDGLGRLLNATGKWGLSSFTYDHLGNLRTRAIGARGLSYQLDPSLRVRMLTRYHPSSPTSVTASLRYDFDKRGNAVAKRELSYANGVVDRIDDRRFDYDSASQLIKARVTRTTASGQTLLANKDYVYDGNGQRVLEQKHGSYDIRFSVFAQGGQLLFEDSIAECTRTDYVRLGALSIARSDDRSAPAAQDTDTDGIPDCLETILGLDPNNAADAAADRDGDGVSNLDEYRAGTSLDRADTDGDGVSDFHELNRDLTDPGSVDTDGDGLSDGFEVSNPGLDPRSGDMDHDGVSDYWELQIATNPANPADGLNDTDGDGYSNRQESQGRGDPQLNGTTPEDGTELWASESFAQFNGEVAIGPDRTLYASGSDGRLYAFHPDGTKRWVYQVPFSSVSDPTVGTDGTIYFASIIQGGVQQGAPRSFIHALNPDGTVRWSRSTTDYLHTAVSLGEGGRLYVGGLRLNEWSGSVTGILLMLNSTGAITGAVTTYDRIETAPAVSFTGDLYVGDYGGSFYAFSPTLTQRWMRSLRTRVTAPASIDADGTVYVGDGLGYVYAINTDNTLRWEAQLSTSGSQYSSVVIGTGGTVYAGSYNSKLFALSAANGATLWSANTTGTTYTPALAQDGTIYATTFGGDLLAFDPTGTKLWTMSAGANLNSSAVLDRDGTIYFGTTAGQIHAVADNGGGPARTPWPMRGHDSASTGYTCFNERAFSVTADVDGDRIDDCSELRYGLDPANAADGTADMDGDGLLNWEEHERGLRLDLADTDGDGLNDGIEVLTWHTDPKLADTDHDGLPDGLEVQNQTNPLDVSDAFADADGDGFSNRQESWAGTDMRNAGSAPTLGQVARYEVLGYTQKEVAVGRDGTIYQNSSNGLEALYPDFTQKWHFATPIVGTPVIGRDGTIYVTGARDTVKQETRLYALLPNGAVRWSVRFESATSQYGLYAPPVLGPSGVIYVMETGQHSQGDLLHAYDENGVHLPEWGGGGRVFARRPYIAALPNGDVVAYDSLNSLSVRRGNNGTELWRRPGGGYAYNGPIVGADSTIYLPQGGSLLAINPANGQTIWNSSGVEGPALIDGQNRMITFCGYVTDLCAVDLATGNRLWTDTNGYNYVGTPVIDSEGTILALTQNNMFVAINGDGTLRWETPVQVNSGASYPVVLNDGTIYVGAIGKRLLLIGSAHDVASSPWPSHNRNQRNSRSAANLPDVEPSQAPILTITAPTAASIRVDVGQAINATAVASDFQDGSLNASIQWTSSISGLVGTGPTLPLGNLAIGTHTLTASVTDSSSLSASASRSIEVGVFPPELTVYQPYDGQVYDHGSAVTFDAIATDVKDGDISASVRWTSSLNGELGSGRGLSRSDLSIGTHLITATSTDSSGSVSTRSVTIQVQALPPSVDMYSPYEMQEYEFGLPADFYGYAYDQVDGDLADNLRWVSDLDGELGTGRSISVPNLRLGTHMITASVADSTGAVGSLTRPIVVRHIPPYLSVSSPWFFEDIQYGDFLEFSAYADDLLDGDLTESIQWSSNLDGPLATGGGAGSSELSVGFHTITASVTDSSGQTTTQNRTVRVSSPDNTAPFVSISSPVAGAQVYLNDVVTLTATAFDTQDGNLGASIQWSSSLEGPLGTGATLNVATLRVGTHSLRAFVADSTTGKGAATVQITVLPIPPDYPPTIRFTSIGVGSRITTDAAFPLSAVASDREEGDISSRLTWSSSLDGPLGSGATTFVSGLSVGTHDITARVEDNYGNVVTATRTIEVYPDGESLLLNDGFSVQTGPDVLAGWQSFDDGTSFPSRWMVVSGALGEYGNASAGSSSAAVIDKPGTYMRQTTGTYWLDYKLEARLRSTDNDGIGLMFRYVDNNNYYRFSMDSERQFRRLVKKVNGVYTLLWSDAVPYVVGQNYEVAITAEGSTITLDIDGVQLWSGTDTSHRRGTIALYSWNETQAFFDNVKVTNLRTTESNDAPQLTITGPANNSSHTVGLPVLLSGTALDFEDGTLSGNIDWSSDVDGVLGTGAMLNVSTLQLGAHVITASVTDSDGVASTATVNITIVPPFNEPPTVGVSAPAEGATFNVGATVSFTGTASDAEDGDISNGITWSSSRNGLLGTGASLAVSSLSAGTHVITASITDSGLKSAVATRNITVVVPGNNQPTLTLSAPLNGAAFQVGQTVTLTGTASDTEDGTLTSSINWSSSINGALGTGGSLNVTTLTGGVHTITATVEDSMGGTRSATATITVVPTAGVLLRDDFNDNNYTGWTVTDQGTVSAPSAWSASTGALRQTRDIHSTPTTAATVPKTGTFNRYTSGSSWTNYSVTAELSSSDNDTLGVMFRYTNTSNYYRFSMDAERTQRRLTKVRNGTWTTLWSDTTAYTLNRTYVLEIIANGSNLTVKLDGVQLWSGNDTQTLTTGTIAMYSWQNTGAQFDNVLVRNLSVPLSGINEPKRGLDRARGNSQMLANRERKPRPAPPRAPPERVALIAALHPEYRAGGEGVVR